MRHAIEYAGDRFGNGFVTCRAQAASIADESGKIYRIIGQVSEVHEDNKGALSEKLIALTGFDYEKLSYHRPLVDGIMRTLDGAPDTGAAVRAVLAAAGRQFNVSRAYIFESTEDGLYVNNTYEWCNDGIEPQITLLVNIPILDFGGDYRKNFNEEGIFYCPNLEDCSEELQELLGAQGILSTLQVSITEEGKFKGFVGFDDCVIHRLWTQDQINALVFIARLISEIICERRGSGQ